mmetsp:Transcript_13606/g.9793  ORF Transcript_13606/g.9793 Transcript_13606/m.9793 type:complete len:82 (+) Transcript_13606:21-266(+)
MTILQFKPKNRTEKDLLVLKNFFHSFQVFKCFDDTFYHDLASYCKIQYFTEGDILQVNSYVFILLKGVVNLRNKRTRKVVK